ncbi:aminoglycoside resistance protein [Actinomadura sp. KC06]|uniref:aminoglycoside phosphotransferase family protein n=1 Tax=Actinomadura sp. KC06 TaxID=2530369 RepID=UPI0010531EDD|nr:aminoglycoside phosphotransferase family protein [Actinomadura sp. KC06]TDD34777.1 aminoglycoside resistance protein [Actinomadura sp. KC06]
MPSPITPPALVRNAVETWGADGRRWLDALPTIIDAVADDWRLRIGRMFELSYHWVAEATQLDDGSPAVLKLGPPQPGHLAIEAAALGLYDGRGAVRLLKHDPARGALLLERANPGTLARTLLPDKDEEATAAVITIMRRLHRTPPPDCPLPHLSTESASFKDHLRRFPGDDPLPRHLVDRAGSLFDELCSDTTDQVVLHGDLHHDNVLKATREPWLAIDPHGYIGDRGYDAGALLYNPDPDDRDEDLLKLVPARVEQLADGMSLPRERVEAWGFVTAVLSEVWTAEAWTPTQPTQTTRALDVAMHLSRRQ